MDLTDLRPQLIAEQQVGEIHARRPSQRVIPPGSHVDIKELKGAVAGIPLVFELGEAVIADRAQEPHRQLRELRPADGLHIGAGAAEVRRMLAAPADGHARQRPAIPAENTVSVLFVPAPGDHLLDDDLAFRDDPSGPPEGADELDPGVGAPRLYPAGVEEMLL